MTVMLSCLPRFVLLTDLHISHLHPLRRPHGHLSHRPLALAVPALRHLKKLRLKELHARAELAENFLSSEGALPELFMLCALWLAPPELNLDPLLTLLVPIAAKLRAYPPLAAADVVRRCARWVRRRRCRCSKSVSQSPC
jgi:hypothetical protein